MVHLSGAALPQFYNVIDGQRAPTVNEFEVINPATASVLCKCPAATTQQADQAIAAAKAAFLTWRMTPLDERKAVLRKAAEALVPHIDLLARVLTLEQGKPLAAAKEEIEGCVFWLKQIADETEIPREVRKDDAEELIQVVYQPLGVVVGITPWNYPAVIAALKIATPLICGNTVVIKPSPFTPLSTLLMGDLLKNVFPVGTVNIVAGGNDLGAYLVAHPDVSAITFTGSVSTGKKIFETCGKSIKRVTLELGGNDAAIVRQDCDLERYAQAIFNGAFTNSGQLCCAIKRLYVHESKVEDLCQRFVKLIVQQKVGNGLEDGTTFGPINNKMQYDRVTELLNDAVTHGGQVVCGGFPESSAMGYAFPLTVVSNVQEGVRLVDEEQFGPVLPVLTFSSDDEAIKRANNTSFGLGASVWSSDLGVATDMALQLQAGTVWVNQHAAIAPCAPFGGVKESGIGREGGEWGIRQFLEPQSLVIRK